jgi:hypothetical protein
MYANHPGRSPARLQRCRCYSIKDFLTRRAGRKDQAFSKNKDNLDLRARLAGRKRARDRQEQQARDGHGG